ncbi:methyl-accepting chemotaxis protein [Thiomicrospira microaerophila]|uniref:methyl-accepting chemotaxis protein n=1 Tax=Thiomicrospira microaerophila TaxID=406020 RepID=UPI00069703FC|nr:methyl-accepting chemotaxis protein [Thiomicrospira microaerophila]
MRNNQPVTQKEILIPDHYILSTSTDLQGTILSASDDFIKVSGYDRKEIIGQPHNILRHPDVPAAVFADMWATLKKGKTWAAFVKNRAKSGDHYWVLANASPIEENGQVVGYVSVRTPANTKQVHAAESLYKQIASGEKLIQGGVVRSAKATRWDFLTIKGGLSKVMLVSSAFILALGMTLLGAGFYATQIAPIEQRELALEIERSKALIENHLEGKVVSVTDIAASMTHQETLKQALMDPSAQAQATAYLSATRDHFRQATDYQNIRAHLHSADKRSMIKSWNPDVSGEATAHPLLNQVVTQGKSQGSLTLDFNGFAVGVTGFAPIYHQGQVMGALSVSGGVASVTRELSGLGVDWVMLVSEQAFAGQMPGSLQSNQVFSSGYRLAHNNWFDAGVVKRLQTMLPDVLSGAQQQAYLINGQVIVDLPAYDRQGQIVGRHLLVHSAAQIEQQIQSAVHQAIMLIGSVIFIVLVIVGLLILQVRQRAIKPLSELSQAMKHMVKTGRFNERVVLLDKGDEIAQVVNTFNGFAGNVQRALTNINDVMSSVAKGDFDVAITDNLQGDLAVMKQAVNGSVASVNNTMQALSDVMDHLYNGEFDITMPDSVEGAFRYKVDQAMQALQETIQGIRVVMGKMEEGDFHYRVEVEARGDLLKLKNSINDSMESMSSSISKISEVVAAQAAGDLTVALPAGHFKGELHKLKNSINYSMEKLKEVVLAVSEAAHIVNGASHEVSQGSLDLSQRVQEQAAALEQTSATMDEMNSVVQSNTQNALQTAQVAKEVQTKAHQGAAVMQQTIEAMNSIQESSHKIADIVTLIDGIAFQTNLLALNAAVEAARAGEHGRGFAVVAGEVRALAQKSADAAKDIKGLIDESVGRIDQGTKLASESGEVLQGINQAINGVAEMINQIAQASGEQADGIKQVHNAIAQIDGVTQQNAALVEETSAASESLSEQASILQQDMAFFKTGKAASTAAVGQSSPKPAPKTLAKPAAQAGAKSALPTAPARRPQATAAETKGNSNEWSEF